MGMCTSKNKGSTSYDCDCRKDPRITVHKMRLLQQEIDVILKQREEDNEVYEREMMVLGIKEAEWRKERKKLREEVKLLRRLLADREEKISKMEDETTKAEKKNDKSVGNSGETESTTTTASLMLVEQMREERARRDETVEKWKMLYLAIKNELDDLIQRTHQGALHWRTDEEDLVEELQGELKEKEETIDFLKAQIASMEDEEYKRKREVDILRQSLKIMSSKKGITSAKPVAKSPSKPTHTPKLVCPTKSLTKLALM